ncbi:hypothetical protein Tco_1439341 [Tanacetum coccineum]
MKVKGFMWCMQKAMARVSRGYGLAVANKYRFIQAWIAKRKSSFGTLVETSIDGPAGLEIDNPGTTMEEYVQFETKRALRNEEVYNQETVKYEFDFSSEPALKFELINNVNLENETSLPECNYEVYSSMGNEDDKLDIRHFLRNSSVKPLRNTVNTIIDAYVDMSKNLREICAQVELGIICSICISSTDTAYSSLNTAYQIIEYGISIA